MNESWFNDLNTVANRRESARYRRRPLGAAAAASLLKAAGARDEACAYASSVRDAPPSTPCALFRGSSEEAPALEPLVGAATREEHNREPFFDVLATLR